VHANLLSNVKQKKKV